jgi:hypothetical protein
MKKQINLDKLTDEELLKMRFRDLGLKIKDTPLEGCISRLYEELSAKGIDFHPRCYLADEWLCPDGEPVIGIAFYLAHPRLKKLEQKMMLEVEGGDEVSCMRLLRHEMGHVLNYAYLLHKRKRWSKHFGPFQAEYGESYKYRPYSKSFVRHLEDWYAQYHPDEDFAETFAVWLNPESDWKEKYKGWKALKKLEYVDKLMKEIAGKRAKKEKGERYWDVSKLKTKLETHYKRRKKLLEEHYADFHDFHLKRIFPSETSNKKKNKAAKFLRQNRKDILNRVALWTGERKFIINDLLKDLVERTRALSLATGPDEKMDLVNISIYVTTQIMNYRYTGSYKRKK